MNLKKQEGEWLAGPLLGLPGVEVYLLHPSTAQAEDLGGICRRNVMETHLEHRAARNPVSRREAGKGNETDLSNRSKPCGRSDAQIAVRTRFLGNIH